MISLLKKTRDCKIGQCPKCNGDLYEEMVERGDYHPDHERIWYERMIVCSSCNFAEACEYEDQEDE